MIVLPLKVTKSRAQFSHIVIGLWCWILSLTSIPGTLANRRPRNVTFSLGKNPNWLISLISLFGLLVDHTMRRMLITKLWTWRGTVNTNMPPYLMTSLVGDNDECLSLSKYKPQNQALTWWSIVSASIKHNPKIGVLLV